MKKSRKKNSIIKRSIFIIAIGIFVCFIGLATAKFNVGMFYENGDHVWYRTVRFDDPFLFGIGE
ncbi:MAG: hypothetical protein R3Y67_01505 [Eubacteriales bacterium]